MLPSRKSSVVLRDEGGAGRERRPGTPFLQRPGLVATVFLAPFLILFLVFRVWPIISAVSISLWDIQSIGQGEFIGLGNYGALLDDERFFAALKNTVLYTGGTLLLPHC